MQWSSGLEPEQPHRCLCRGCRAEAPLLKPRKMLVRVEECFERAVAAAEMTEMTLPVRGLGLPVRVAMLAELERPSCRSTRRYKIEV